MGNNNKLRRRGIYVVINVALIALLVTTIIFVFSNSKKFDHQQEVAVNQLTYLALRDLHYQPKKFDDSLSVEVFDQLLKSFDYNKRFFLDSDIRMFKFYRLMLDDMFKLSNLTIFDLVLDTYLTRFNQVKDFYKEILSQPFDFSEDDYIELNPEKLDYAKSIDELKERWYKLLKYETLIKLSTHIDEQEQAKKRGDTSFNFKSLEELEKQSREEVLKQYEDWFNFMSKLNREDYFSLYINSFTSVFDPYTVYMPPKREEDFQIYMSGQLEGIGATLQYKNGEIRVVNIIPGGAAWRQGELEVGDVILKVAQGDEPPVSVVGMRLDDAVRLIRGPKGTKVRLTVRKPDGTIKEISIIRDVVIIQDTYVRSVILSKPGDDHKIGYMYIPSFYADFQKKNGRRVYKDVVEELRKLQDDDIDGLIIDLRNNGGGSLQDVINIVGLFIPQGPVVQVRNRRGMIQVYKDTDPSIMYSGPLMIMVDEFSASASEIMAAAIQDYHRGIIFGSEHTHGKGTVQTMMAYDQYVNDPSLRPLGSLKITIQKFYRINGGSTQLRGVRSDIIVPTQYMFVESGERELDYALPWDKINPQNYKVWNIKYDIDKIVKRSQKRIAQDTAFQIVKDYALFLKQNRENTRIPLNLDKYRELVKYRREKTKPFNRLRRAQKQIVIRFLTDDSLRFQTDTLAKIRYEDWRKNLKKDIYLPEAVNVMIDIANSIK